MNMDKLLITNLVCSSIYTSYAFAAQILIYPLIQERWYTEHQERSFKSYFFFILVELITAVMLAVQSDYMIAPLVMLIISYVFMILIFRLEEKFVTHIINEDYEWFRRYGILRCSICLVRWSYLYIYYLIA